MTSGCTSPVFPCRFPFLAGKSPNNHAGVVPARLVDGDVLKMGIYPEVSMAAGIPCGLPLEKSIKIHQFRIWSMGDLQDPKMELPIPYMFGLFFRPKIQGIYTQNMARNMVQYSTSINWILFYSRWDGKATISMAIFNNYVSLYQWVNIRWANSYDISL